MGSKKKKQKAVEEPKVSGFALAVIKAPTALAFVWPVLLVVGGYFAWHRWGADQINRRFNSLSVEQIALSAPPEYIRTDVVESVFHSTDLTRVSLLDVQATSQIANAFATNAWVESVTRIKKTSQGKVAIDVVYRKPVAMVHVISQHPEVEGGAYFPVDRKGILLPTDDFTREDTHRYIQIIVEDVYPSGGTGVSFGDSRVRELSALAQLLLPYRDKLRIESLEVAQSTGAHDTHMTYKMRLEGNRDVIWGSAPGREGVHEPDAKTKIQNLIADPSIQSLQLHVAARTNVPVR